MSKLLFKQTLSEVLPSSSLTTSPPETVTSSIRQHTSGICAKCQHAGQVNNNLEIILGVFKVGRNSGFFNPKEVKTKSGRASLFACDIIVSSFLCGLSW